MAKRKRVPDRSYIVDENGNRVSVVLPIEQYAEMLSDVADLATIAERRDEKTVNHRDLVSRLKADGLL